MRVVDTSAWIEGIINGGANPVIRAELPRREHCVVPTIVQLEIAKWSAGNLPKGIADAVIAYTTQCVVIDLDTSIAIRAAEFGRLHKLATADAIIYATTISQDADLLTCDAHFKDLPYVTFIPKTVS